jgi:hypothetical protein
MGLSDLPAVRSMDDPGGTVQRSQYRHVHAGLRSQHRSRSPYPVHRNIPKSNFQEREKMKKHIRYFAMVLILVMVGISACGGATATGTPVPTSTPVDIPAIFTEAAQTVIFQLTQQAPTITPTPLFTNTPTLPPATPMTPSPTVQKCEDAAFVSDVTIPDGTQMVVNQHFTKTWRVMNTGTCTWLTSFYLGFSYGESMGGVTKVSLASAVAAGQTVDLSANLIVPNKTGKLTGVWAIFDNTGVNFGKVLTVVINVGVPSATPTGGATATPGLTATNTLAPSETPTK